MERDFSTPHLHKQVTKVEAEERMERSFPGLPIALHLSASQGRVVPERDGPFFVQESLSF